MKNNLDLTGKVALITGASRGLGASYAKTLASRGAHVAINFMSREADAIRLKSEINKEGFTAEIFKADVTDEQEVISLISSIRKELGPVDILVLNATLVHVHKPIEELTWADMLAHFHFFVKSPLLLAQQVLPEMKQKKWGRIIHIGSEVFERGIPEFCNYVAAKGAQMGLMRSWANELGQHGITVNLIAPGWIPTEMHANDPKEMLEEYAAHVPLKHMGEPEDIGEMVAFLASDAAKFITGQRYTVNGGNTMP
jgi:3-oxoacyl-[acyl-carrier protein] reductase